MKYWNAEENSVRQCGGDRDIKHAVEDKTAAACGMEMAGTSKSFCNIVHPNPLGCVKGGTLQEQLTQENDRQVRIAVSHS